MIILPYSSLGVITYEGQILFDKNHSCCLSCFEFFQTHVALLETFLAINFKTIYTKKLQTMAKVLTKEDMKLDMKSDMMSDVLDSISEGMGNEEEQEELYNQILAEAGVKIEGGMVGAGKEALTFNAVNAGPQKQVS